MQIKAHDYRDMYDELGIDLADIGCVMLDLDGRMIPNHFKEDELYYTDNPKLWWIKGFVVGEVPHVTLLYGLLKSGKEYEKYINRVLKDWRIASVQIKEVDYFESTYEGAEYYCIIAHVNIDDNLLEGHNRLCLLPHIHTFSDYKGHITIAYIKKDDQLRDHMIQTYNESLKGKELIVTGLNLGGNKP
jgi:hypothetical protein